MNVHIHLAVGEVKIDDVVTGETADDIVATVRDRTAAKAGFLVGAMVRRMTPLDFAREATRRYNAAANQTDPLPESCDEFLTQAVAKGLATIESEDETA